MDDIFISCDLIYNKILKYYIKKMEKEGKEIDLFNFDIFCLFDSNTYNNYNLLNKKALLKKEKKEKRKLFLSSVLNMPFICPVVVIIPILNSDEVIKVKLQMDDIKTILKHFYKDSTISITYYTLEEIINSNAYIDTIKPFRGAVVSKNIKEIESHKVLRKTKDN